MATKDTPGQRQTTPAHRGDGRDRATGRRGRQGTAGEALSDDVDAILDEIDEVLEENAEEFVRSYVQKGGIGQRQADDLTASPVRSAQVPDIDEGKDPRGF